jgi:hypothetical protein
MEGQTPQLAPSQLYDKRRSKDAARLRAYNKILEQIYNRIRVMSELPNSQCYLLYTVPPFILGLPKLDLEDCTVYLIYQLRHAGYDVRYTPPNMLYISWLHHEKSYLVEQSPIMAAMLDSAERTRAELERKEREASRLIAPKKSHRKVRSEIPGGLQSVSGSTAVAAGGAGFSARTSAAVNTVLNRPLSNPTAGPPPPSAADYVPPATFLQSVQNPKTDAVYPKSVHEYFR